MTKYEHMKHDFLLRLKNSGAEGYEISLHIMERDYGIEQRFIREQLIEWAERGFIWLGAWKGSEFRSFETWENTNAFFEFAGPHIKVKLLAEGDKELERLEEIKHRPIGF